MSVPSVDELEAEGMEALRRVLRHPRGDGFADAVDSITALAGRARGYEEALTGIRGVLAGPDMGFTHQEEVDEAFAEAPSLANAALGVTQ